MRRGRLVAQELSATASCSFEGSEKHLEDCVQEKVRGWGWGGGRGKGVAGRRALKGRKGESIQRHSTAHLGFTIEVMVAVDALIGPPWKAGERGMRV